ncbi:MAG: hypothetical protein V1904_05220 [Bacteroidota bacterium]
MRTINLLFAAIIMLAISSCGSKSGSTSDTLSFSSAVEYNDFIIGQQEKILDCHKACTDAVDRNDITFAKTKLDELAKQCKTSVDTLNKMDAYNSNTAFRDAGVKLFSFYKDFAGKGFKEELEIMAKPQLTPDDENRINQIENEFSTKEGDLYNAFIEAQNKFASENDIILK